MHVTLNLISIKPPDFLFKVFATIMSAILDGKIAYDFEFDTTK